MSDWLAGFGGYAPRSPRPRPAAPPAAADHGDESEPSPYWRKGQTRTRAEVACCPECGATRIKIRTPRGHMTVLLECLKCGHNWKDQRCDRLA